MQGTIKKIIDQRGFGFIAVEGQSDDIFFHRSQVKGDIVFEQLKEGQTVTFDLEESQKGPQAVNVTAN